MTLEKHNMLYAVQFALHEYDENGAVSRRTMEMLGARAILLRYEIEGEVAEAVEQKAAKEAAAKKIEMAEAVKPLVKKNKAKKRGRRRKYCLYSGEPLTGKQTKFASTAYARAYWKKRNKDKVKAYNKKWREKQNA
jgi:hypothetical protein